VPADNVPMTGSIGAGIEARQAGSVPAGASTASDLPQPEPLNRMCQ